jgi:leucyl aminopeptidase
LSYAPRGAKAHLGLVGKGITFDSGGLDIKTQAGMYTMKSDMSGAGAVFAATRAIADLGLKIKVTTYGSLAENMPSGSAYRPSDVLTIYGGKTVENFNSDAEGRIVMADALARMSAEDEPDLIVDVATLTGACIVALGERTGGVMSNRDEVAARILQAAAASGERFWQLPIVEEARGFLDSEVADLKSGRSGPGGAMTAAAFLREFVGETPWAHLDIAGPSFNTGPAYGYVPSGGTGIAVRTLVTLAEQLAG